MAKKNTPTLGDHIDTFLADVERRRDLRPNTIRSYQSDLTLAARILTMPLAAIADADLDAVLQPLHPATRRRRASVLNQFFLWAVREQVCPTNPLTGYAVPRVERRLPRPIRARSDRKALDAAIKAAPQPFHVIFLLLRETGLRVREVLKLNSEDVALDSGHESLHLHSPKNRADRMQPLGLNFTLKALPKLRSYIRSLGTLQPYEPVFRSKRGTRISYDAVEYQWWRACKRAGLVDEHGQPRYTLHQLRHTRGTEMVEERYPLHVVQKALGHVDPRSTQVYADLSDMQLRHELERHRR